MEPETAHFQQGFQLDIYFYWITPVTDLYILSIHAKFCLRS